MALNPREDMVFHTILGLLLGLGGLFGAIVWYHNISNNSSGGTATIGAYLAPVILGVFAGVILLWGILSLILLLLEIMDH